MRDRLSFTRFLRLGIEDSIPDATTVWLFREKLAKAFASLRLTEPWYHSRPMIHDLITAFIVAFAAVTASDQLS